MRPHARDVAAAFYANLFAAAPQLRPLFGGDMQEQGRKLMAVLGLAVSGLTNLPALLPTVRALGERHRGYGVEPAHYGIVGAALIQTLEEGFGDAFSPELREAWAAAYAILAGVMCEPAQARAA